MNPVSPNAALIVIDVQKAWDDPRWGRRNNPDAERNIASLLAAWRASKRPVFFVRHDSRFTGSPLHPSSPGNAIKDVVAPLPSEAVIGKNVNSAFIGTDLEARMRRARVDQAVVVGLTTAHCVSTTARMAGNLGFDTVVVSDAAAAFEWKGHDGRTVSPDDVHYHALASIHGEFANVVPTAEVLSALAPA